MPLKIQTRGNLQITGDAASFSALAGSLLAVVDAGHGFNSDDETLPDLILVDDAGKVRFPTRPGKPPIVPAGTPDAPVEPKPAEPDHAKAPRK